MLKGEVTIPCLVDQGPNSPRYGAKHSEETKAIWSAKISNTVYQYNSE